MSARGHIRYLLQQDIDQEKWDHCISKSANGLIYSYSFYLNKMSKHWDGLVLNDYEAVMPLPWNKKYGFYYLYQPAFIALSGVTGKAVDAELVTDFIRQIPKKFRLIEVSLNPGNPLVADQAEIRLQQNYTLALNNSYSQTAADYRENVKRNIKRAKQAGCYSLANISTTEIIHLHRQQMRHTINTTDDDYLHFNTLFEELKQQGQAITYGIFGRDQKLLASAIYFFSHQRAYYILVGNDPDGKTMGASHYLIDRFIEDHSGRDLILDFEGSDIRNVAFFYSGFGAILETYPSLAINRLPWFVKWLKQ